MRDWLSLPPSSPSSIKNISSSSDEDEDHSYDIINKATTTEEEGNRSEEISSWLSLLTVFGVAKKLSSIRSNSIRSNSIRSTSKKTRSASVSSDATTTTNSSNQRHLVVVKEKDVKNILNNNNKILFNDDDYEEEDLSIIGETTDEDFNHHGETTTEEEGDFSHEETEEEEEEEEDVTTFKRTLSASSLASSTDTDNSTPASSQIIQSSPTKYLNEMTNKNTITTTRNVKICWNHGGKKIQVTGEFDNWSASVDMIQDTENSNKCHVYIPMDSTKDIEFKFIVDGEWKYASDLPHRTDWRGNVNNVIYKKEKTDATAF